MTLSDQKSGYHFFLVNLSRAVAWEVQWGRWISSREGYVSYRVIHSPPQILLFMLLWQVHESEDGRCRCCLCHCSGLAAVRPALPWRPQHNFHHRCLYARLQRSWCFPLDARNWGKRHQHRVSKNPSPSTADNVGLGFEAGKSSSWLDPHSKVSLSQRLDSLWTSVE